MQEVAVQALTISPDKRWEYNVKGYECHASCGQDAGGPQRSSRRRGGGWYHFRCCHSWKSSRRGGQTVSEGLGIVRLGIVQRLIRSQAYTLQSSPNPSSERLRLLSRSYTICLNPSLSRIELRYYKLPPHLYHRKLFHNTLACWALWR